MEFMEHDRNIARLVDAALRMFNISSVDGRRGVACHVLDAVTPDAARNLSDTSAPTDTQDKQQID